MDGRLPGQKLLSLATLGARSTNKPVSHIKQNLWQREEQRIEFLKHRVQACLFARSEIAGLKDLVLNPVDPVCTEPHTPARRCSLLRAEGKLWNPPISGQGAEATPQGLSAAASTGLDQANFRTWVFGGSSLFGGGSLCFGPGGPGGASEPAGRLALQQLSGETGREAPPVRHLMKH